MSGEQHGPAYTALNPSQGVPALVRDDGTVEIAPFQHGMAGDHHTVLPAP